MGQLVDLAQAKADRAPTLAGAAACMNCHHSWVAVAPVGTHELECPKCHAVKGYFVATAMRGSQRFECNCGCDLFRISPDVGPYCINCAEPANGWF